MTDPTPFDGQFQELRGKIGEYLRLNSAYLNALSGSCNGITMSFNYDLGFGKKCKVTFEFTK